MEIISTQATAVPVNTSSPKGTDNNDDEVQLDPPNQAIVIALCQSCLQMEEQNVKWLPGRATHQLIQALHLYL